MDASEHFGLLDLLWTWLRGRVRTLVYSVAKIENPRVGGSIPSSATILLTLLMLACGDRCEVLCRDVSFRLDACRGTSISWADLGARNRADFVDQCRIDWDRTSAGLTSSDLAEALDICRSGIDELQTLDCEELVAIYAP